MLRKLLNNKAKFLTLKQKWYEKILLTSRMEKSIFSSRQTQASIR